jgi:hypothetical protein
MQFILGFKDPGSIGVNDLKILPVEHAQDPMAGRLCFRGNDRHIFPHQFIHQGRFTYVGFPDDIYESGFMFRGIGQYFWVYKSMIKIGKKSRKQELKIIKRCLNSISGIRFLLMAKDLTALPEKVR